MGSLRKKKGGGVMLGKEKESGRLNHPQTAFLPLAVLAQKNISQFAKKGQGYFAMIRIGKSLFVKFPRRHGGKVRIQPSKKNLRKWGLYQNVLRSLKKID